MELFIRYISFAIHIKIIEVNKIVQNQIIKCLNVLVLETEHANLKAL